MPGTTATTLNGLLDLLIEETEGETVSVVRLLRIVGQRSYGPLIMLLGFIAVSPLTIIPGATWLVALLTLLITGQIVVGMSRPWIPKQVLEYKFKRELLLKGAESARGWASVFDRILKPRLSFLTRKPFIQLVALMCVAAALVTFPLGLVPFGPLLPGLTILVFGLGLIARDGIVVLLASASLTGSIIVLIRLMERIGVLGWLPF
ncbi:MAG: polysaccharide synthesis protein exod [Ponticaulis sp.]|nr:polysaccharide synthesis protein exod [Ponticaulis sp.]